MNSLRKFWGRAGRHAAQSPAKRVRHVLRGVELVEPRCLLAVTPIDVGAVYVERDIGSDHAGDAFEMTFSGGAAGTQLRRVTIDGDQNITGFSVGDVFFDTRHAGLGADEAFDFSLDASTGIDRVTAFVEDGTSLLVLEFAGFDPGETLKFSIDVDEVEDFDGSQTDPDYLNDGFDPITSGVEFQNSRFTTEFSAPHFYDVTETVTFRNRYDDALAASGLDLPADNFQNQRDRSAGAFAQLQQQAIPAALSGYVYHDRNNNGQREAGEEAISGTTVRVVPLQTVDVQDPITVVTGASGYYSVTGLMPGTYRVVEVSQPDGFLDGQDTAGLVDGVTSGTAGNDVIDGLFLGGGSQGVEFNFGELRPVSITGQVHLSTRDGDCFSDDVDHQPIAGATVLLVDSDGQVLEQTTTDENGNYRFEGLFPGTYGVVELTPAGLINGGAQAGKVNGAARGLVVDADTITQIVLASGQSAVDFDFCEHLPSSLSGRVYHDRDNDGVRESTELGIAGVTVSLFDDRNQLVATTVTDVNGDYQFTGLRLGNYTIVETQPPQWVDGKDVAGTVRGLQVGTALNPGDRISQIQIGWGDHGIDYDFGEYLHASLQGRVQLSTRDDDCFSENVEHDPVAGAIVRLLDASGKLVAEAVTDANGAYRFTGLDPGSYTIVELTPDGLIDGGARAGTVGGKSDGQVADAGTIAGIDLKSGEAGVDYLFCEHRPATLSGVVYHDRDQDGQRETAEEGIGNATVQLRDPQGILVAQTTTDSGGRYRFSHLRAGTYELVEVQPQDFVDGLDTPGTVNGRTVGVALNPGDRMSGVQLGWGDQGVNYNFGEYRFASLHGRVQLSTRDDDCFGEDVAHDPVAGAVVRLFDAQGTLVAETRSDASGAYSFAGLDPGSYSIVELTPVGLIDGGAQAGTVNGLTVGRVVDSGRIGGIQLSSGESGTDYLFCEHAPSTLSGTVYHDRNQDGIRDDREEGIAGVTVELRDRQGNLVSQSVTDGSGRYVFKNLRFGTYDAVEIHPQGWLDGLDTAGTVHGITSGQAQNPGDSIRQIELGWGDNGQDFNFGENLPGTISGRVHVDIVLDCQLNPAAGEYTLEGVQVQLLNASGQVISTTVTDANGTYRFNALAPGAYAVREIQPSGYFNGNNTIDGSRLDEVSLIVGSGQAIRDVNFCEIPPAKLSGFVFQDGPAIPLGTGEELPADISSLRNGVRTPDDKPLAGVTLQLRNGITGAPIMAVSALPGTYSPGPIQTTTDARGFYEFAGLRPGTYAVFQVQPATYIDGVDTPGSLSGFAFNPGQPVPEFVTQTLTVDPQNNGIVRISLPPASRSIENNFSEVVIERISITLLRPAPPTPLPPRATLPMVEGIYIDGLFPRNSWEYVSLGDGSDSTRAHTWHLSVLDGGSVRGDGVAVDDRPRIWLVRVPELIQSKYGRLEDGAWRFEGRYGLREQPAPTLTFGLAGAIPVTGDFNGDGYDELAMFFKGEWFIDVNGNGQWDSEDLWAQLGDKNDYPVAGDWDGDGKDDIGIYGRKWQGDAHAIARDPGLPDAENDRSGRPKNIPPKPGDAASGVRLMQRSSRGQMRADLIDHVFHFGQPADRPVVGDWNGDGITSIGVFREGVWYLDVDGDGAWTENDQQFRFGRAGDAAIVGDWNGDGLSDPGVYRHGEFILDTNGNRQWDAADRRVQGGTQDDYPVAGDWDGDGKDEPGVYKAQCTPAAVQVADKAA